MFVIRRLPILEYIVSSTNAHRASKEGKKAIELKVENITACIRSRTFVSLCPGLILVPLGKSGRRMSSVP